MKSKYKRYGTSLRTQPWSDDPQPTQMQSMITSTICEWYDAKHRRTSTEELGFINSIAPNSCPYCSSIRFIRYGKRNGMQMFLCIGCGRKFNPFTNTIFDSRKIPITEWIEYLLHLFEFHSIATSSRDNRNSSSTGSYWLKKVFAVLSECQKDVMLKGRVYLDEMFFPVAKSEEIAYDGRKLRGISRNKICVAVATDGNGIVISVEYTSKPSMASTWRALGNHIEPGSCLVHDGEKSHRILIDFLKLKSEVHDTRHTKGLDDRNNPLDPINDLHSLIRRFMNGHGGYDRDSLQDWMNLTWFVLSDPYNVYEKMERFFNMAVCARVRLKYRDVMSKKDEDSDV